MTFEQEEHTQSEWDDYEKKKLKGKAKSEKKMNYKQYKQKLMFRNLAFNVKGNTEAIAKKVLPIVKDLANNATTNADSLVERNVVANSNGFTNRPIVNVHKLKKVIPKKKERKDTFEEWAEAYA